MADLKAAAKKSIQKLKAVLDKNEKGDTALSINLDDDLATDKIKNIGFTTNESDAMDTLGNELFHNQGFEYLYFDLTKLIRRLACEYVVSKDKTLFDKFLNDHYREPENLRVFIPIIGLEATEPTTLQNVTLLKFPIDGLELNENGYFEGIGTVAQVYVSGTDPSRMRDRALAIINHELKVLRVGLRAHNQIHDQQLLFKPGRGWAIENGRIGWTDHKDTAYSLGISKSFLAENLVGQPLYAIPFAPTNRIERKVKLALEWLDQSRIATDPLMRLLYDMFALETLLGDRSEGKKARLLAFRRALLSTIINDHYPDPYKIITLYEQVRSYAVHGGEIKEYDEKDAKSLSWSVRLALNEYLQIVDSNGFTRPKQVFDYLDAHEKHDELLDWLTKLDPTWGELAKT